MKEKKLIKENECQRQDFSQLHCINKILEELKNNFGQSNERNNQSKRKGGKES